MVALIAIALTTILFSTLFTIVSGMTENLQRQTMRQAGGDGMAVLKYVSDEEYEAVKDHRLIKEISYNRVLCSEIKNEELLKRHGELYYMDDTGMKLGFCEPTTGRKPQAENEIIMDTKTMQLLGVPEELGARVTLLMRVHGSDVAREFVLSGWWEADPVVNVSIMVASRAYVDKYEMELYNSYREDYDMTGVINCYIMFGNSVNLEKKLARVITESGFSMKEEDENYIGGNVNWAYLSAHFSPDVVTVSMVLGVAALIVLSGYLIIYNIFQLSVIRDIRFYGLLKTIGVTGKQIHRIVRRQAMLLSLIGIPVGLCVGYATGCKLVPVMMDITAYKGAGVSTTANPYIFMFSALFALATVLISTAKPERIAAKVSPIEAVKYTDAGGAAPKGRRKRREILVIVSMSLSLVLFHTIYTMSIGFDMDKYLSTFVDTDFLIAHADYFNSSYHGTESALSEQMILAVQQQPGFEAGGVYLNDALSAEGFSAEQPKEYKPNELENRDGNGNLICDVYGLDAFTLDRLEVIDGELDVEKLKSGHYILEGVQLDDNEAALWETSNYKVGDKVILHNYKGSAENRTENEYCTWEYEVLAHVKIKHYTNSTRCYIGFSSFYLPAEIYCKMVEKPAVMSYAFNVREEHRTDIEEFLKNYTANTEPVMSYSSKSVHEAEFVQMRNMVLLVGGMLSFIVGLIGVLNFVNSMLTSMLARRREFAVLQAVGMTKRQLRKMLSREGLRYTIGAGLLTVCLGTLLSLLAVRELGGKLWFFTYHFTILPFAVSIPVLFLIGYGLPYLFTGLVIKQSIVERLRQSE